MTPRPLWRRLLRWALRLVLVAVGVRLLLALFLTQLIALAAPSSDRRAASVGTVESAGPSSLTTPAVA